ncbi:hypothetical protein BDW62DRAFT_181788 [Aspergillus aurantiobrunneus]
MSASELKDLLFFEDADTLAFIDPPSYKPMWSMQPSSAQSIGHRIHSWNLLRTGSPILNQLFDERVQERNIKHRGGLPEGIKYIIDLTPPSADEDAVLVLTELSCPLGIRTWADSKSRWDLPRAHVAGVDTPPLPGAGRGGSGCLSEYSPSRHRAGIVHILRALEGFNVCIDTPCKLWTFFAVAKLYEISTIPEISLLVRSWIYESNNKRLIELHPEVTYRIAKGIQCDYLLQDSFCVLAGEEALLLLRNLGAPTPKKQQITVHGRPQDALDDDDVQRVQYAGESFLNQVIEQFVQLAGSEMNWLKDSRMFRNVVYYPKGLPEDEAVDNLITTLKDFVRASIFVSLSQPHTTWLPVKYKFEPNTSYPGNEFLDVHKSMAPIERIMTRTFWVHLGERKLTDDDGQASLSVNLNTSLAILGGGHKAFRDQHLATIRRVSSQELHSRANAFNRLVNPFYFSTSPSAQPASNYDSETFGHDRTFSVPEFLKDVQLLISKFAERIIAPSRPLMTYNLTDTLTSLTEREYRYLPLWAGGCDDGTGGVYAEQIPLAETDGFSAPGPSIHTGSTPPSIALSIISFSESTVHGASHRATQGFASEVVSVNSEAISESGKESVEGPSDFQTVDDELSLALDSSADDTDAFFDDSDSESDDTVIINHGDISDLSEFEEMDLNDKSMQSLPVREKNAVV